MTIKSIYLDTIKNSNTLNAFDMIRKMLLNTPTFASKLPFDVKNYNEALLLWCEYKNNKTLSFHNTIVKHAFDFHLTNVDHVILFHQHNMENTLLMGKVNNKYYNILIPIQFPKNSLLANCEHSVIATYLKS